MSSNLKIIKICEFCKQEFIARKMKSEKVGRKHMFGRSTTLNLERSDETKE